MTLSSNWKLICKKLVKKTTALISHSSRKLPHGTSPRLRRMNICTNFTSDWRFYSFLEIIPDFESIIYIFILGSSQLVCTAKSAAVYYLSNCAILQFMLDQVILVRPRNKGASSLPCCFCSISGAIQLTHPCFTGSLCHYHSSDFSCVQRSLRVYVGFMQSEAVNRRALEC